MIVPIGRAQERNITLERGHVIARFATPLSSGNLIALVHRLNLAPKELYFEIPTSAESPLVGGYILKPGESVEQGFQSLQEKHATFLREAMVSLEEAKAVTPDPVMVSQMDDLENQLRVAPGAEPMITAVRVENSPTVLEMLDGHLVRSIEATHAVGNESVTALTNSNEKNFPWAPTSGTSKVTQNSTYQTFTFTNYGAFGATWSYQHETQIYNTDFATDAGYWSSNLPNAYHDYDFTDKKGVDGISPVFIATVGTATASGLKIHTVYYTYIGLEPGTIDRTEVKIRGQRGHRSPSFCYSSWCVYADQTTFPGSLTTFTAPWTTVFWTF
jgi:hypothetical protein